MKPMNSDLIDGDLSVQVVGDARQTEASQVHGVLGQLLGDGEGVQVLELWEPVHDSLVLSHGVALLSKDLHQQNFGLHVGHNS